VITEKGSVPPKSRVPSICTPQGLSSPGCPGRLSPRVPVMPLCNACWQRVPVILP